MTALNPATADYLARLAAVEASPIYLGTPEQARAQHEAAADAWNTAPDVIRSATDVVLGGVRVRIVEPKDVPHPGIVLYIHGGGWVTGSLHSYDRLSRTLAHHLERRIAVVDYDLAPEAKHPTQVLQVLSVWAALRDRYGPRLAVAGDSAGGYLAVAAAKLAPQLGLRADRLVLLYPVVSPALDTPSAQTLARGYRLETAAMRWYWDHYLPADAPVAPLLDAQLGSLPPTLVMTAGFDPLRDEGVDLVAALRAAGVVAQHLEITDQTHGFLRIEEARRSALEALVEVAAFLDGSEGPQC